MFAPDLSRTGLIGGLPLVNQGFIPSSSRTKNRHGLPRPQRLTPLRGRSWFDIAIPSCHLEPAATMYKCPNYHVPRIRHGSLGKPYCHMVVSPSSKIHGNPERKAASEMPSDLVPHAEKPFRRAIAISSFGPCLTS